MSQKLFYVRLDAYLVHSQYFIIIFLEYIGVHWSI